MIPTGKSEHVTSVTDTHLQINSKSGTDSPRVNNERKKTRKAGSEVDSSDPNWPRNLSVSDGISASYEKPGRTDRMISDKTFFQFVVLCFVVPGNPAGDLNFSY